MPKLPRDISGRDQAKRLQKMGFSVDRQVGSHIRLTALIQGQSYHLTVPLPLA